MALQLQTHAADLLWPDIMTARLNRSERRLATVRNAWTLLSGILETAVEYGYLTVNPARGVKFPPQALRDAPALIVGEEFGKLLGEVVEPYRTMIGLIAVTG